jgi:sortase A
VDWVKVMSGGKGSQMTRRWAGLLVGVVSLTVACGTQGDHESATTFAPTPDRQLDLTIDFIPVAPPTAVPATFPPLPVISVLPAVAPSARGRALAGKPVEVSPLPAEDVTPVPSGGAAAGQSSGSTGGSSGSGGATGSSGEPVGFLDAPSIGLATFIVENGWSKRQLDRGGAGLGGTSVVSEGNIVLFGHRTSHGGPFRRIDELEIGADLDVTVPNGPTRRYRVVEKFLDMPDAVQWADETNTIDGRSTVTLITCAHADGSPGGTARRWFVRAVAI